MLTQTELKRQLHYDPQTGIFIWLVSPSKNTPLGSIAGANGTGYRLIRICGGRYKAHRLAWLYMTGEWPKNLLDHKDLDGFNNCWSNLREATNSQNKANMRARADNKSGFKGVSFYRPTKRWRAGIGFQGTRKTIGYFKTPEEASAAYLKEAQRLFGEFART